MSWKKHTPLLSALAAALLYGLNAPLAKLLLNTVGPMSMVGLLYFGAGAGMLLLRLASRIDSRERSLARKDLPAVVAMVLLDIVAPYLLMKGLQGCFAANASLLNNFEIVATSVIASCFFKETVSPRTWTAIALVTIASMLLTVDFQDARALSFSMDSFLVLGACACWGIENNCTRVLSSASPLEIVMVKGFGSGISALAIAVACGENLPSPLPFLEAMLLGFVAYGLSICLYVYAQRHLGASRTSACYAAAPFMGVLMSMMILLELPAWHFWLAFAMMLSGVYLIAKGK